MSHDPGTVKALQPLVPVQERKAASASCYPLREGGRVFLVISQSQLDPLHPLPLDTRGELVGRKQDYFDLNLGPMGASNGIKSVLHVLRAAIANRSNNEDACPLPPLFLHAEGGIID